MLGARLPAFKSLPVKVAAKTGTAESKAKVSGKIVTGLNGFMISFAPADEPSDSGLRGNRKPQQRVPPQLRSSQKYTRLTLRPTAAASIPRKATARCSAEERGISDG